MSSSFGEALIDKAPPYISTAIGIACMVEDNEDMEEAGSSSSDFESTSDIMEDPRKAQIQDFCIQLHKLEHQELIDPVSSRALQIANLKDHLSELETHRKKSAALYNFDRDINKSEKVTKYFFRPPAPILRRVCIPSVQQADGSITTDPKEMAQAHNTYWTNVFQSPSKEYQIDTRTHDEELMQQHLQHTTARISPEDRAYLDSSLTAHDFRLAITSSKSHKVPWYDGLPIEYYRLFTSEWARVLELVHSF
uniref:AlNc14C93G5772 protein n=1 Tax=Albugo laibachii Nc14 TaxID=890382 RepID=F0WGP5_9STRA|nr:AlNc14C93G5772 [Albugo laibachii Nc14]|eukprot:CCA20409.1 AlNc14C93G5772 [Albugo laibachii Nc14]